MRKRRVVGRIYGMKYSWKGNKDIRRAWKGVGKLGWLHKSQHPHHVKVSSREHERGRERERKPKHRTRTWRPVQKIIIVMFDRPSYSMDNNAYSERPCSDKLYKHKWLSSPQSVVRVDLHRQITGLWPAGWVIDLLRWGELYVGQADNFVPLCRAGAHGLDRSQALVFVSTLQVCLTIQ